MMEKIYTVDVVWYSIALTQKISETKKIKAFNKKQMENILDNYIECRCGNRWTKSFTITNIEKISY